MLASQKNNATVTLSVFEQHLKKALKLFDDPQRLGEESTLASPYFLSQALKGLNDADSALARGITLCREIRSAAATLWGGPLPVTLGEMKAQLLTIRQEPGSARYAYLVLELRCFQDYFAPKRTSEIWENEQYLPGSQSEHYRDFDAAIAFLAQAVLDRLHPTLRPELPVMPTGMVGIEALTEQAAQALLHRQTVSLSGPSGMGKTSLGATVFHKLAAYPCFWFTFRLTLNDHLSSVLFSLGHFLYTQDASHLWQLVVATGGALDDPNIALAAVRQDLAQLYQQHPCCLLCFDEVDRLKNVADDDAKLAHSQISEFIEGLRNQVALLLIGQKPVIESDRHITLSGLTTAQIDHFFQQCTIGLSKTELQQIQRYSGGNPRLLQLCLATHQLGESIHGMLDAIGKSAGLLPMMRRLWLRLSVVEQRLLQRLAVFRRPAPLPNGIQETALPPLIQRKLLLVDERGGVEVMPWLRIRLCDDMAAELRQQYHLEAADIRLGVGEYSEAAYHYWQGQQQAKAIQVWFPQRKNEIQRGQASVALAIFANFTSAGLSKADSKALSIIQAELYRLCGELEKGLTVLQPQDWSGEQEINIQGQALQGELLELTGQVEAALQTLDGGIVTATRILGQIVDLRYRRGRLYIRQKEMSQAWRETRLAECQVHLLRGILQDEEGHYTDAQISFQHALTIAEALQDVYMIAEAERNLATTYGRLQNATKAEEHAQQALTLYERIHDHFGIARLYDNLTFIYQRTQQFEKAIQAATKALHFFKIAKSPYYAAIVATNLAETYCDLGDLAQAQRYAYEVIELEERQPYPYALFTLGRVKQTQGAWTEAEAYFAQSAQMAQQNQDLFMHAYAEREWATTLLAQQQVENGRGLLQKALVLFQQLGIENEINQTKQMLQQLA